MAKTYADLFGSSAGGTGGARYIKWDKVGDVLAFVVNGEAVSDHPQIDFATKRPKWMTHAAGDFKPDGKPKWVAQAEGTFNPDDYEKVFPALEVMIPVSVAAKAGDESFVPFDAEWTFKGDQKKKFQDALLEFDAPLEIGTVIQVKWLAEGKPRVYAIKIKAGE